MAQLGLPGILVRVGPLDLPDCKDLPETKETLALRDHQVPLE